MKYMKKSDFEIVVPRKLWETLEKLPPKRCGSYPCKPIILKLLREKGPIWKWADLSRAIQSNFGYYVSPDTIRKWYYYEVKNREVDGDLMNYLSNAK